MTLTQDAPLNFANADHGEFTGAPEQPYWGFAGRGCEEQGAHEQWGMAATTCAPQNLKAAISPCKHKL